MTTILSFCDLETLNEIADKYHFRNSFEIEQEEAYDFCRTFMQAVSLGLNVSPADIDAVIKIRDSLSVGY